MSTYTLEQFRAACGLPGPWRLGCVGPEYDIREPKTLLCPFAVVGRSPRADFRLDDPQVSRKHVLLQVIGGQLFCVDLGTPTGVSHPIGFQGSGWIEWATPLGIGPFSITPECDSGTSFITDTCEKNPLSSIPAEEDSLPAVELEIDAGDNSPHFFWRMNRHLVLIGRDNKCKLQMSSSTVSRFHCALLRTPGGLWVIDLLSRTGVWCNRRRTRFARLGPDDELVVGRFTMRIHYDVISSPSTGSSSAFLPPRIEDALPWLDAVGRPDGGNPTNAMVVRPTQPQALQATGSNNRDSGTISVTGQANGALAETGTDGVPAAVLNVLNQFSEMQRNMFEQFQQGMLMMVQMFGALHRDQLKLIREELSHIQQLTAKLQVLHLEAARHAMKKPAAGASAAKSPPKAATSSTEAKPPSAPASQKNKPTHISRSASHPGPSNAAEKTAQPGKSKPTPGDRGSQSAADTSPTDDIHAWLSAQIDAIQKERQSHWERIISFFRHP